MRIEFYLTDAMEVPHFVPVVRALRAMDIDAVFVSCRTAHTVPNGWYDADVAEQLIDETGLPVVTRPAPAADVAVTTQVEDIVREYRRLRVRMMYGVNVVAGTFTVTRRPHVGFDLHLVHGAFNRRVARQFVRDERIRIMGYPRYDSWFDGSSDSRDRAAVRRRYGVEASRPTVLYLPTWEQRSSIDGFADSVLSLASRYEVLIKPHHCTYRTEPARMRRLNGGRARVLAPSTPSPDAFALADVVVADISSGAFTEAILLGKKVITIATSLELTRLLVPGLEGGIPICRAHDELPARIEELRNTGADTSATDDIRRDLFDVTHGGDALRAATAIVELAEARGSRGWRSAALECRWWQRRLRKSVRDGGRRLHTVRRALGRRARSVITEPSRPGAR